MKLWWVAGLCLGLTLSAAEAQPLRNEVEIRDADGKLYAIAVICSDCKEDGKASCAPGALDGWVDGKPCGSCLVKSNAQTLIKYPYDLHFTGKLVDKDGNPVTNRFVKMLLPNGWGVRSKSSATGTFRLMLGATEDRKGTKPIVTSLGDRLDLTSGKDDEQFTIYLMPPDYTPCSGSGPEKAETKPKLKTKAN